MPPQHAATTRWSPRLLHDFTNASDLLATADYLIGGDLPVFPCAPGGKRPLSTHGFQDASADPAIIGSWRRRWPEANIGIPTGAASGVVVVDVDVHSTGTGFPAFEQTQLAGLVVGWALARPDALRRCPRLLPERCCGRAALLAGPWQARRLPRRRRLHRRPALPRYGDGVSRRTGKSPSRSITNPGRWTLPGFEGSSTHRAPCAHRRTCPCSGPVRTSSSHGL